MPKTEGEDYYASAYQLLDSTKLRDPYDTKIPLLVFGRACEILAFAKVFKRPFSVEIAAFHLRGGEASLKNHLTRLRKLGYLMHTTGGGFVITKRGKTARAYEIADITFPRGCRWVLPLLSFLRAVSIEHVANAFNKRFLDYYDESVVDLEFLGKGVEYPVRDDSDEENLELLIPNQQEDTTLLHPKDLGKAENAMPSSVPPSKPLNVVDDDWEMGTYEEIDGQPGRYKRVADRKKTVFDL